MEAMFTFLPLQPPKLNSLNCKVIAILELPIILAINLTAFLSIQNYSYLTVFTSLIYCTNQTSILY